LAQVLEKQLGRNVAPNTLVVAPAELITNRILAGAGVKLNWHRNLHFCTDEPSRSTQVDSSGHAPSSELPGAQGYAQFSRRRLRSCFLRPRPRPGREKIGPIERLTCIIIVFQTPKLKFWVKLILLEELHAANFLECSIPTR